MAPLPDDKQLRFVKPEERPTMSPKLARRTAMVGMLALGLFAILFFRLWFLQVLSTNQYAKAASVNFVRDVVVQAPRGEILDYHDKKLVFLDGPGIVVELAELANG